ncbi:lysozyme [Paraburkholderia sp. HP33-1]|uniref:lysozyme n=1 Tax=Paraburkholderia sp. HP33-1 TaxID=2883243 RepID=UPI001F462D5F|nr:glycoside hydrolase family protein [Paraburkholderia sp. HP33-1]
MANESKKLSSTGRTALRLREGVVLRYYNDIANNCTYGLGTLVHTGPCTAAELRRPVTPADVDIQLAAGVQAAESAVRNRVTDHELTQEQFDSLVSFTYNTGATGARQALEAANRGQLNEVASHMGQNVYVHPRDAHGRRLPAVRVPGLISRRREEAAPFLMRGQR